MREHNSYNKIFDYVKNDVDLDNIMQYYPNFLEIILNDLKDDSEWYFSHYFFPIDSEI